MRQPLKPFSVEVRHTARRKQSAANNPPRDLLSSLGPSKDESYDAALKAADALFGPSSMAAPAAEALTAKDVFETAAAIFSPMSPQRAPGRILQAIEEPPPIDATSVEIEKAPARRGRPPGSKNKVQRPAAAAKRPIFQAIDEEIDADEKLPPAAADELIAALFGDHETIDETPAAPRASITVMEMGERLRFSWIHKELQPGERWKRRMSRVCW
jgi:hypothetical protein